MLIQSKDKTPFKSLIYLRPPQNMKKKKQNDGPILLILAAGGVLLLLAGGERVQIARACVGF